MRIGINLITLSTDRFGGAEQYVKNLIWHLANSPENVELFLFLTRSYRDIFPQHHEKIKIIILKDIKNLDKIHEDIHKLQLDLWFSPLHRSYLPNIQLPTVVTIHDLLHVSYPQFVPGQLEENNQYYQAFAPSFDGIITVSNFSKAAIIQHLKLSEEKIYVIYHDAPLFFNKTTNDLKSVNIKKKYDLPDDYALYPASYQPHKNHLNLLKAILHLNHQYHKKISLVLTGFSYKGNIIFQDVIKFIKEHHLENQVRLLGFLPPDEMPSLYKNASFLIFPSLYEGFGIPLVEAMKSQCPIICSNRGSIPEIVRDAALQFNPESPEEIAQSILKVLHPQTRLELIEKGNERGKAFSWTKTVQETLTVFQSVSRKGEKS
ncbi:glycosyltransferase family 4 protein [Niallia endozanthoxylica]|uniref:Glycosyltransferase family 4 protein n=1 Tax=Niallia endozanthoxylica TaxID=2036016 RepID=A0A5J5HGV5_9BACI|nr:glycosyltransferase family 1 protein [Niallia endozanthoxylica]KAA9019491.1 glycosyltransferase family 4 protein [Niallia endozanthoxylica]